MHSKRKPVPSPLHPLQHASLLKGRDEAYRTELPLQETLVAPLYSPPQTQENTKNRSCIPLLPWESRARIWSRFLAACNGLKRATVLSL